MALEQALGQHCFRNAQCYSGWCNEGFCARPVNTHHPCNSHRDNCPYNLYCSSFSHTCVTADYVAKSKCSCASDCKYNELCIKGKCKKTKAIGSKCSVYGPDNCETGSVCTFIKSDERDKPRCFELCSANVPCPDGYACAKLKYQSQALCVPQNAFLMADVMRYARITGTIMFIAMIMFGLAYAWIKLTKSKKDPRLKNKKRLRLQYEGNGLASITFVASPDQSPAPVAASQLFNSSANTPSIPPPSYDEAVGSIRRCLVRGVISVKLRSFGFLFVCLLFALLEMMDCGENLSSKNSDYQKGSSSMIPLLQTRSSRVYQSDSTSSQEEVHSEPPLSATTDTSIDLTQEYAYPEVVKNLKSVYREMAVTSGLYALNIASAVGIVLVNKTIYSVYRFNYGVVLTFYHFLLTSLGLKLLANLKVFTPKDVKLLKILPVSMSFCAYVVLTNLSLQYNSGTFYQILVVPTIALLQYLLYGIKTEAALIKPMMVMLLGVGVATLTEVKLSLFGLAIAMSGVLMTAIYQILVGAKQKELGLNAIQLLYYQAPLSSVLLLIVAPFLNDISKVLTFHYTKELVLAIVASALCAFFLNLSMYLVLGRSTALTYNVIGLSKLFLVLALNYLIFESSNLSVFNVLGVMLAFAGMCSYSFQKFKVLAEETKRATSFDNKAQ